MSKDAGLPNVCAKHLPPATETADDCPRCRALSVGFRARILCRTHAVAAPAAPAPAAHPPPRPPRQPEAAPLEAVSGVHARLDLDATSLHATLADLAPLARFAAAGGLRALPAAPRDGQTGGGDPHLFVDLMHDRGDAARARLAHRRLLLVHPALHPALLWLADRGDARPTVREAAALYARECGPIDLRDAADRARALREKAGRDLLLAERKHREAQRAARRVITEEVAKLRDLVANLRALIPQRQLEEEAAVADLAAWGRRALALACCAWEATEAGTEAPAVTR